MGLDGKHPISIPDGPIDVGEVIPNCGHHYETVIGYIECDCGRNIHITPKDWHEPPERI